MATTQANINVSVSGLGAIDKLNFGVDKLHAGFSSLKLAIAGAGFAALGRSALAMADQLQDLSNSTGIAVGKLIEFKKALTVSGGEAGEMPKAISTFVRAIDEAAQGSLKAQNNFRELGISIGDLRNLSEQALLDKAVKGLAKIEDPARRAGLMMQYFGKSFKSVDVKELAEKLAAGAGSADKYAQSIKRAAELQDQLDEAAGTLKMAFLEAFSGIIQMATDFNTAIKENKGNMDSLVFAIKAAGIALTVAFSSSILLGFVGLIGTLLRGLSAITAMTSIGALPSWLIAASGAAARFIPALRAIGILISAGLGIYAATKLFDDWGSIATNAISRITESILNLVGTIANIPTDAIAGFFNLFGAGIKDPVGLGTPFLKLQDYLKKTREESEKTAKKLKEATQTKDEKKPAGPVREVDTTADDNKRKSIQQIGDEFALNNKRLNEQLELDIQLIGKSKDYADVLKAQAENTKRTEDSVKQLTQAKATMSKDEKEAGMGAVYDEQIKRVQALGVAEQKRLDELIPKLGEAQSIEQVRQFGLSSEIELNNSLKAIKDNIKKSTMSEIEAKKFDLQIAAESRAQQAIAQEEQRQGRKLSENERQAYMQKAKEGLVDLQDAAEEEYKNSRKFATGWKNAFDSYVSNATNAAMKAQRIFETFSQALEDALYKFFTTGKLGWKDFANTVIQEMIRIETKQLAANILTGGRSAGGGIFSAIGDLFRAGGGPVSANQPYIVGERGPELFVPNSGGSIVANGGLGGQAVTYNINAVDSNSFKQMLAADPTFLHAVAEQGRRRLPGAR